MASRTEASEEALQSIVLRKSGNRKLIKSALETGDGASPRFKDAKIEGNLNHQGSQLAFFGGSLVSQPSSTGETSGFTAGSGTTVNDDSTFTGNVGTTAYTISDVVKHLKNTNLLAD